MSGIIDRILRGESPRAPFTLTASGTDALQRSRSGGGSRTPSTGIRKPVQSARRRPSVVTILSIVVAVLAAGAAAWIGLRGRSGGATPAEVPSGASGAYVEHGGSNQLVGRNLVASLSSFDPLGDGSESDSMLKLARDGKASTAWLTSCYDNRYFGAKQGVGVIVKLDGAATGRLALTMPSTPWNVEIFASDVPATSLAGWGNAIARDASQKATTATFTFDSPKRYLLVMLREIGRDAGCNKANPYRGGFSEIAFGA